jgi:hypothetical protein
MLHLLLVLLLRHMSIFKSMDGPSPCCYPVVLRKIQKQNEKRKRGEKTKNQGEVGVPQNYL